MYCKFLNPHSFIVISILLIISFCGVLKFSNCDVHENSVISKKLFSVLRNESYNVQEIKAGPSNASKLSLNKFYISKHMRGNSESGADVDRFPDGFLIGCSTASYQVEGGWNEDGKGENMWDLYTHTRRDLVKDHSDGDIACDSYHQYKKDVELIKNIGFKVYRFSISWSRILPTGDDNIVNEKGVLYYRNLIDELLSNGITPLVTIYHWDLPMPLAKLGGWVNPIMADYYERYARVVFNRFGDKVKLWLTLNEPFQIISGYGDVDFPPAADYHGIGEYLAGHNLLRAHAKGYHLYNREFRSSQKGRVGIALESKFFFPKTDSVEDKEAAQTGMQFTLGWFAHPIYSKEGDYPLVMRTLIEKNSQTEGRSRSRLPKFTEAEVNDIRGSADFLGLNHYTSRIAHFGTDGKVPSWRYDSGIFATVDSSWPTGASEWLKVVPEGFRGLLNWIKKEYDNPNVIVTENGYSDTGELVDNDRIAYYKGYLTELLKAINLDECNVSGYLAWSIMDNFEWFKGYTEHFGLHHVNFEDEQRTRTPKKSVKFFQELIEMRRVPTTF